MTKDTSRRSLLGGVLVTGTVLSVSPAAAQSGNAGDTAPPNYDRSDASGRTRFDHAVRRAFSDHSRSVDLPAGVVSGPAAWPPVGVGDTRFGGFRLRGAGRGETFAVTALQQGSIFASRDVRHPTLTFRAAGPEQGSGALDVGDFRVEGTQLAGVAALRFDALYGSSRASAIDVFQEGTGDGVEIRYMATGAFDFGYAINRDWDGEPATRSGTGFILETQRDSGLARIGKTTARGWATGYRIGRKDAQGPYILSTRVEQAEASMVSTGFEITANARGTTLDTCYFEGVNTGISNLGNALTVINPWMPLSVVGLDDSSDMNGGTVLLGGTISLRRNGSTALRLNATAGLKCVIGTTVVHGAAAEASSSGVAIDVAGVDPRLILLPNLDPDNRWQGRSRKIVDRSWSSDHPRDAGSGVTGLAMYEDRRGRTRVSLERGAHRLHVEPVELGDDAVVDGTLTIGAGSIYIIRLSRPAIVRRIVAPNLPDKTFTLINRNANLVLENGAALVLAERSGRYVPPDAGSIHHFQVTPGPALRIEETGRVANGRRASATLAGAPREGNRPGDSWFFEQARVPGYWNGTQWCRYSDDRPIT